MMQRRGYTCRDGNMSSVMESEWSRGKEICLSLVHLKQTNKQTKQTNKQKTKKQNKNSTLILKVKGACSKIFV